MVRPSLTRLKELLRQSAFDPRADGPNKIIVDTAENNPRYAEDRAKELISQAQAALSKPSPSPLLAAENLDEYNRCMTQAIGLLALARAIRD